MSRVHYLAIPLALALFTACGGVRAQSTNFSMTGEIQAPTCSWRTENVDRTVALDPISLMSLSPGKPAGLTRFSITVDGCSPGMSSAIFIFTGNADARDTLRLVNTGTASGVALELESGDGANIRPTGGFRTVPVVANSATLDLQVGYWYVGPIISSGTVTGQTVVTMLYN